MRPLSKHFASTLLSAVLASTMLLAGCRTHEYNDHETVYYQQWEHETHRDHVDFKQRPDADQKEYWTWREHHPDQP
jgi:hypothetical protein